MAAQSSLFAIKQEHCIAACLGVLVWKMFSFLNLLIRFIVNRKYYRLVFSHRCADAWLFSLSVVLYWTVILSNMERSPERKVLFGVAVLLWDIVAVIEIGARLFIDNTFVNGLGSGGIGPACQIALYYAGIVVVCVTLPLFQKAYLAVHRFLLAVAYKAWSLMKEHLRSYGHLYLVMFGAATVCCAISFGYDSVQVWEGSTKAPEVEKRGRFTILEAVDRDA